MQKRDYAILSLVLFIAIFGIIASINYITANNDSDNKTDEKTICELNKEYQNTAVAPVSCKCPEDYKFEVVSQGWGVCPNENMSDCPASVLKCVKEKENEDKDDGNENDDENQTEIDIDDNGTIKKVKIHIGDDSEKIKKAIKEKNRFKFDSSELPENCTKTGSVMKCDMNGSRTMAVFAGKSGNVILQVKGINATTQVQLYKYNGSVYGLLDNNETLLINYFPDEIREKILERINAKTDGNETIELDEDGEYQVDAKKEARFLGIFKVKEKVRFHVDPETGEILNENAPWWGFLASDVKE